ncbi:MAG: tetratricopeptide repeat protein [Opitutae bacterium]|nr:tetratricopeptide repeat protein [Opitutae bacterium]
MIPPCPTPVRLCALLASLGWACSSLTGQTPPPNIDPDAVAVDEGEPAGAAPPAHQAEAAPPPASGPEDPAGPQALATTGPGAGDAPESNHSPEEHPASSHAAQPANPNIPPPETEAAPRELAGLQRVGLSLTERGDWAAAEIAFRRILASRAAGPAELPPALLGLARVHRRQGALTKAAAIYERFLKDYPGDGLVPDALLELGRTHRALGASQLAIARFYSVINSTIKLPEEGFAHYQMLAKTAQFEIAETHFLLGNFAEAGKFYTRLRLLDLAPADRARAHFKSAYALHLGKDYEGAVTALNSYLEQWPQDEHGPEARYLLALSLRALGRQQQALEATLQLLRTQQAGGDPKAWAYWQRRTGNQLANDFFQNGDTANALAVYQGLAGLSPDAGWRLPITYQIALCHERLRQTDLAITAYQGIVDGAKSPVSAESTELARMAAWRLDQLKWSDHTDRQLASIFASGVAALPKPPAANPPKNPGPPPSHDHSGNPPATPPSL